MYPLGLSILRYFTQWDAVWQIGLQLLPGLLLLHFVLMQVYYFHPSARQVAWTVLATPFELISLILPKRFKKPFRTTTQSTRLKFEKLGRQFFDKVDAKNFSHAYKILNQLTDNPQKNPQETKIYDKNKKLI